jgi:hypothetical protein
MSRCKACDVILTEAELRKKDRVTDEFIDKGVKLREYEGTPQRKFSTKYEVPMFDADGNEFSGRLTRGSKVRVKYAEGKPHPVHGTSTYLSAIKVIELAEATEGGGDF